MASKSEGWSSIISWLIPILIAGIGVWQFYLKEIIWPSTAINITTDLSLKRAGFDEAVDNRSSELEAIELVISAYNPSSSTIFLLNNYWTASAVPVDHTENSEEWKEGLDELINNRFSYALGKHYKKGGAVLVAGGSVFSDDYIRPNEKITATYIFYVPGDLYDLVSVFVELPTVSQMHSYKHGRPAINCLYDSKLSRKCYRATSNNRVMGAIAAAATGIGSTAFGNFIGSLAHAGIGHVITNGTGEDHYELVIADRYGNFSSEFIREYGWQSAVSTAELSLWHGETSSRHTTEVQGKELLQKSE